MMTRSSRATVTRPAPAMLLMMVLSGVAAVGGTAVVKPNVLQIGMLVEMTGTSRMPCEVGSALMAVQQINNNPNILPNHQLNVTVLDTGSSPRKAIFSTLSLLCYQAPASCPKSKLLIGPFISDTTRASQLVAGQMNVAQISPTAGSTELSNRVLYPTFNRITGTASFEGEVISSITAQYGWNSVNVLSSGSVYTDSLISALAVSMAKRGGSLNLVHRALSQDQLIGFLPSLAASPVRVLVLAIWIEEADSVLAAMSKLGMLEASWVVIGTSSWASETASALPETRMLMSGFIGLTDYVAYTSPVYQNFVSAFKAQPNTAQCTFSAGPGVYSSYTYDVVYFAAQALHRVMQENVLSNTTRVLEIIRSTAINGTTGPIELDSNGDRQAAFSLINMQNGAAVDVGEILPHGDSVLISTTQKVVWIGGGVSIPTGKAAILQTPWELEYSVAVALFVAVAISALVVVVCLTLIIVFRRARAIQWSSPRFCYCICVGSLLGCFVVVVDIQSAVSPNDHTCMVVTWLQVVATVTVFGSLFAKTHRLSVIFNNAALRRVQITDKDVFRVLLYLVLLCMVYMTVWQLVAPLHTSQSIVDVFSSESTGVTSQVVIHVCDADTDTEVFFLYAEFALFALFLVWGSLLAYQTRDVPAGFNESKYIGFAIYNMLAVGLVLTPLIVFIQGSPTATMLARTFVLLEPQVVTVLLLFVPKFNAIRKNMIMSEDKSYVVEARTPLPLSTTRHRASTTSSGSSTAKLVHSESTAVMAMPSSTATTKLVLSDSQNAV